MQIGILGSGDYATALAYRFSNSHNVVNWYIRRPEDRERLLSTGHHKHFPDYQFNMNYIKVMSNVAPVVQESDIIILAIPSAYIAQELISIVYTDDSVDIPSKSWVVMSKGLVTYPNLSSCDIITEYLQVVLEDRWSDIFVLSGPSHAEEIITGGFSALGCAQLSNNKPNCSGVDIHGIFSSINIHTSNELIDIKVLQFSSILKNVYGIGAGIVDSLNVGDNTKALFSMICINELSRFLSDLYPADLYPVYLYPYCNCTDRYRIYTMGDILVTMYSNHSRNYRLGRNIVEGNILVPGEKCQVEGFNTITTLHQCASTESGINNLKELPVVRFVSDCIYKASGNKEEIDDMFHKLLYSHL